MKRSFLTLSVSALCLFFAVTVRAKDPVNKVYRIDQRPMLTILEHGGMWPYEGLRDYDLTHHFEGESLLDHTSGFVSTTSSLQSAIEHAIGMARSNELEPVDESFSTFIYEIQPADNFYDLDYSFHQAISALPASSPYRLRLARLVDDYGGLNEFVARGGFSADRIIRYARLNGRMMRVFGTSSYSRLFNEQFWANRWQTADVIYNHAYDNDTSNPLPYTQIGQPSGVTTVAGNSSHVPVSFTCEGVSNSTSRDKRDITTSGSSCRSVQDLKIKRVLYYRELIPVLFDIHAKN